MGRISRCHPFTTRAKYGNGFPQYAAPSPSSEEVVRQIQTGWMFIEYVYSTGLGTHIVRELLFVVGTGTALLS
jgi:hypothetical protein